MVSWIKKWFCKKHATLTFSTKELAQILADNTFNLYRYSVVKCCKGCGKFYVVKKWTMTAKRLRKDIN